MGADTSNGTLKARYEEVSGSDLLNRVLDEPEQMNLSED